ncbi:MAG TPA: transglycosylase domain-containing protein, partial [Thermoanaerobaculia bacterium]|nr:transglycosylase domain-containing protein [Thermoanaerobaculia bacterium]
MPARGTIFRAISIVVVTILVGIAGLAIYVYKESVGKFEVRRLSLPTRVYADYTPLQAGTIVSPDDLLEKLSRLGYREVDSIAQSGDFAEKRGELYIYTREFKHPTGTYASEPIRITFDKGAIASITSLKDGHAIDKAALEPELLTSILSDQLENRQPVTLNQVPQILQDAVIVTEDVRFWHHPGVDPIGIARAVFRNLRGGGIEEGASTLTQQLVKNYYL